MAEKCWSFIYNLSSNNFYEAALQGAMTGVAPFSFGAVFALATPNPVSKSIFGNTAIGTATGFAFRMNAAGDIEAANGTVLQPSGTLLADADNTYGTTPEGDLLNNYKSLLNNAAAPIGSTPLAWPRPRPYELVFIHCNVPASGNQDTYVNGRLVAQTPVGLATNQNPVRIGLDSAGAATSSINVLLAGCYYNSSVFNGEGVASLLQQSLDAKDCLAPFLESQVDYIWSVKRGNAIPAPVLGNPQAPQPALSPAAATWLSKGAAATPIAMELNGSLSYLNTLAIRDLPLQWV